VKNALIAAVVAAVVAAASGTAATIIVTSKNIKNGTIQTVDISAKAKQALKGNRGPRGASGPAGAMGVQGPQGPQGLQGPQGSAGITQVIGVDGTVGAQCPASGGGCRIAASDAVCPPGFKVVSGGHVSGGTGNIVLFSATTGTQQYSVIAENLATSPNTIKATAECVSGPGITATSPASRPSNIESLREALTP
jgi:Collagen triple helix repeat (20 copies)